MQSLTSIVALNEDAAIGVGNALPWKVRSDLAFFRQQTIGHVVIMGRKTFDSLGKGLPDRKNIVVTHGFDLAGLESNCRLAHGIDEAIVTAEDWRTQRQRVFVVGGASMYGQFAPFVDTYLITEVQKYVPEADTFFPVTGLSDKSAWAMSVLQRGMADGARDEADFTIFQFKSLNPGIMASRREAAVLANRSRRTANRLSASRAA